VTEGSVSRQIALLKEGDPHALEWLWNRYRPELERTARQFLRASPRRTADESDIAVGVLESLWRGTKAGRFDALSSREELWGLLVVLAQQKAVNEIRRELRIKRGSGKVRAEADLQQAEHAFHLDECAGATPSPEMLAIVSEERERLLSLLRDDDLRLIAVLVLLGHSQREIADVLGVTPRTIGRKVRLIRATWDCEISE